MFTKRAGGACLSVCGHDIFIRHYFLNCDTHSQSDSIHTYSKQSLALRLKISRISHIGLLKAIHYCIKWLIFQANTMSFLLSNCAFTINSWGCTYKSTNYAKTWHGSIKTNDRNMYKFCNVQLLYSYSLSVFSIPSFYFPYITCCTGSSQIKMPNIKRFSFVMLKEIQRWLWCV